MAYCHECGSEVAENIAFCPYCGFNLQQNAAAVGGGNDSRESVVVAESENKPDESQTSNAKPEFEQNTVITDPAEISANQTDAILNEPYPNKNASAVQFAKAEDAESNHPDDVETLKPIVDEAALIEERQADTGEDIEKAKYENFVIERESIRNESESAITEESAFVPDEEEKAHPSYSQSESELMSYEEAEIKENLSEEGIPLQVAREPGINIEKPISKPEIELEDAKINCPPPMFDSVRIMEKPPATVKGKSDNENVKNLNSDEAAQEHSVLVVQNPLSTKIGKEDSGRSFTAQNIAGNDTDGRKSAKLKPLVEGTILNGRYEIVRKIGGGGMGAVYLASDKNLGGVLRAVKEMVQSYIEDEQQEKAISDFKRESLLLTSLEHQSIPTIYDYFFDDKEARFYLVMKYINGGDLASRLRSSPEGRIEEKVVTEWAIQVADVLDYLHNRQPAIIYRDLKPANVMVDGNSSRVMLIDFGIARWVNKEEKGVTAVGTMGYAPPELFSGNVEPRSDIYSLGSTLFHLLTGADPQSNPLLIFDFQKHPRPRQINPQISDQMEKILMRAVEYSADKRFSSAAEMRDSLTKHLLNLKANKVTYGVKETPSPMAFSDQPVFCGFCGQKIVATDMFCAFCGAKQPLAQKGVQSRDRLPGNLTAQLLIVGTNELETPAFLLEKYENLVGRRDPMSNIFPEIDLSKFDPHTKISRKHARIWREGMNYLVEDLGSSNGTVILPSVKETVRLKPRQPFTLNNGDKIKLGDTTLHFVVL
jgi:serine/threonine-protein kinase